MFEGLLQPAHLLLIGIIAMIFFGPKRLPELGKGLGEAISGFREGLKGQPKPNDEAPADEQKSVE